MQRRNFLKAALLGGVAGAVSLKGSDLLATEVLAPSSREATPAEVPDLVAVMGGSPEQLYARAIAEMGGMGAFIKKGMKVVVKPNIGWDKTPEMAANTNPQLVAAIVKDCLAAGAAEVKVFDHSCDQWEGCYKNSGIAQAVKDAGGIMVDAHEERSYKEVTVSQAVRMKNPKIHEAIVDCDAWINVPILKNHGGAKFTCCMKNYMGIVWDRRYLHSHNLQQCIADAAAYSKHPVLNIVDAYRIMNQNGPKGKSLNDVQTPKALFMSKDIVALDTAALQFFNQYTKLSLQDVQHIGFAQAHHLGTTNLDSLNIKRIKL